MSFVRDLTRTHQLMQKTPYQLSAAHQIAQSGALECTIKISG